MSLQFLERGLSSKPMSINSVTRNDNSSFTSYLSRNWYTSRVRESRTFDTRIEGIRDPVSQEWGFDTPFMIGYEQDLYSFGSEPLEVVEQIPGYQRIITFSLNLHLLHCDFGHRIRKRGIIFLWTYNDDLVSGRLWHFFPNQRGCVSQRWPYFFPYYYWYLIWLSLFTYPLRLRHSHVGELTFPIIINDWQVKKSFSYSYLKSLGYWLSS